MSRTGRWPSARGIAPAGAQRDTINQLYVTDSKGRLVDYVRLRNLVSFRRKPRCWNCWRTAVFLRATDNQETAVAAFKKYDVTMLPVVDSNEVLVGVVTVE